MVFGEQSAEMLSVSYNYLLITAVPGILAGVMFVYQQLLRGMGNTRESMYSGFVQLGVKITVIAFGFFIARNMAAIWLAWPLSFAMAAVFAMIKCRKLNYHTLIA